jgi:predicted RNase H-like nuclease
MTSIGVDLAWGSRAASGFAVITPDRRLVEVATAVTDDDIISLMRPRLADGCVVAFDAPLIVNNATGTRRCEALVNHHFRRYHAGCHPSNRGMAAFRDGGRALRLAQLLDLDVDPHSIRERRAVEVYPHPATVALFGLDRILKYKNRPGRTLASMRTELLRLVSLMEGVVGSPHWRDIHRAIGRASNKSRLKSVEDQVDAIVCAYVAWYAQARPAGVRLLGNGTDGCILTPVTAEMAAQIDAS